MQPLFPNLRLPGAPAGSAPSGDSAPPSSPSPSARAPARTDGAAGAWAPGAGGAGRTRSGSPAEGSADVRTRGGPSRQTPAEAAAHRRLARRHKRALRQAARAAAQGAAPAGARGASLPMPTPPAALQLAPPATGPAPPLADGEATARRAATAPRATVARLFEERARLLAQNHVMASMLLVLRDERALFGLPALHFALAPTLDAVGRRGVVATYHSAEAPPWAVAAPAAAAAHAASRPDAPPGGAPSSEGFNAVRDAPAATAEAADLLGLLAELTRGL